MMRAPTHSAIDAAELRVALARRNTWDDLGRVRVAFRTALARPSTLALIAGAAGLFGFWIARRPEPQATAASKTGAATTNATAGLVLTFIVRYAMQRLPRILEQVWAARQERGAPVAAQVEAPVSAPS